MNITMLAECLKPWMETDTWETGHPNDKKRFHQFLRAEFDELGKSIFAEHFVEVMSINAKARGLTGPHYDHVIDKFAAKEDAISEFMNNMSH